MGAAKMCSTVQHMDMERAVVMGAMASVRGVKDCGLYRDGLYEVCECETEYQHHHNSTEGEARRVEESA
jgi:hypothetical protein